MIENQMCDDITTDKFDYELNTYKPKKYKSKMVVGNNFTVYNEKHFNKIQKAMWKILLGIKIIDVNEEF
jgi:hypothetical protein